MKKFLFVLLLLMLMSGTCFAGSLSDVLGDFDLSKNVVGTYNSDGTSEDSTVYIIGTGNLQGDKLYGSGSFVSEIYEMDQPANFSSSSAVVGDYASNAFEQGSWEAR